MSVDIYHYCCGLPRIDYCFAVVVTSSGQPPYFISRRTDTGDDLVDLVPTLYTSSPIDWQIYNFRNVCHQ